MNDRQQTILRQLLLRKNWGEKQLADALNLSLRQLHYAISKINEELETQSFPKIMKKEGKYLYSDKIKEFLQVNLQTKHLDLHQEMRVKALILLILTKSDYVSLDHFVYSLSLSKNTVLADIKKARSLLSVYDIKLSYSRQEGYALIGKEWQKRQVLNQMLFDLYESGGKALLAHLMSDLEEQTDIVKEALHQVEQFLGITYTDNDFYHLIYFISAVLQRINQGQGIEDFTGLVLEEIQGTREYQSLLYADQFPKLPEKEYLYISLHLLGSKTSTYAPLGQNDLADLSQALHLFLTEFEAHALLFFQDKQALLYKLLNHFKPAYYRIKYHLTSENVLYEQIVDKYRVLHNFVRAAMGPLEDFFQTDISDKETAYITLFIGGHLLEKGQGEFADKTIKAVIICPNGISMSKLMEVELKHVFPEFVFYPSISLREYQGFVLPHDIVFTSVPMETDKPLFLINALSESQEKMTLRRQVISSIFKLHFEELDFAKMMTIIKKYADIHDERKLQQELSRFLLADETAKKEQQSTKKELETLSDLLSEETIQFVSDRKSWENYLEVLCQPLLDNASVSDRYVSALKTSYADKPAYIMLRKQLVLLHLDPTLYQQKLGVSILMIKEGLLYQGELIHLLVLLTTPDKTSHLSCLLDIRKLAGNPDLVQKLMKTTSSKEALNLLKTQL